MCCIHVNMYDRCMLLFSHIILCLSTTVVVCTCVHFCFFVYDIFTLCIYILIFKRNLYNYTDAYILTVFPMTCTPLFSNVINLADPMTYLPQLNQGRPVNGKEPWISLRTLPFGSCTLAIETRSDWLTLEKILRVLAEDLLTQEIEHGNWKRGHDQVCCPCGTWMWSRFQLERCLCLADCDYEMLG